MSQINKATARGQFLCLLLSPAAILDNIESPPMAYTEKN